MREAGNNPQSSAGMASLVRYTMPHLPMVCNGAESASSSFTLRILGWLRFVVFPVSVRMRRKYACVNQSKRGRNRTNMLVIGDQREQSSSGVSIFPVSTTSPSNGTKRHSQSRAAIVRFAPPYSPIRHLRDFFLSITATKQGKFAESFALNATRTLESLKRTLLGMIALSLTSQSEAF